MVLISGYFVTSLIFLKKTSYSGEKADFYGLISDKADDILKSAYRMESNALGFLLTGNKENENVFFQTKAEVSEHYLDLKKLCDQFEMAQAHIIKLEGLIQQRLEEVDLLFVQDTSLVDVNHERIIIIEESALLMNEISEVLNDIRNISLQRRNQNREYAIRSSNNTVFILSLFGFVVLFIVLISFDKMRKEIKINEQKSAEISKMVNELKVVNENLESFAYVASHDLNEPLRKIRIFGEMVLDELKQEKVDYNSVTMHTERMQKSSERMQALITDLLTYSRVSKRMEDLTEIDLDNVVQQVLNDLQFTIADTKAEINREDLPRKIRADKTQMHQLFQNLIANALKFRKNDVNPIIKIKAVLLPKNSKELSQYGSVSNQNYWRIEVSDNGIGFDMQYRERIFSIFQRLHGRNEFKGTGIGLSICKKIVEQHDGFITAFSEEGKGASFVVYLPVS